MRKESYRVSLRTSNHVRSRSVIDIKSFTPLKLRVVMLVPTFPFKPFTVRFGCGNVHLPGASKPPEQKPSGKNSRGGKLPGYKSKGRTPISSVCRTCLGFGKAFVKTSAVCSGSRQFCMSRMFMSTSSRTQWCRNAMCFDLA